MVNDSIKPISARFHDCEVGWLSITISTGAQSITIPGSHWLDPYPDMISWLERISSGVTSCRWRIDTEGTIVVVAVFRRQDGIARVLAYSFLDNTPDPIPDFPEAENIYDKALMDALIDPDQFVGEVYSKFREFGKSQEYKPREWGYKTVSELLCELELKEPKYRMENIRILDGDGIMDMIDDVDQMDRFNGVYLTDDTPFEPVKKLIEAIPTLEGTYREYFERLHNDCFFNLPPNYKKLPEDFRALCLDALLCGCVSSWYGEDIRKLRSDKLDRVIK